MRFLPALLLLTWFSGPALAAANAKPPASVIVAEVRADRFVDRIEALGTLRANETVMLTSSVSDTVTVIHFEDGQRVEKGDVLVEMTSGEETAQLEEARATVDEAKLQLDRVKALTKQGNAPRAMLDQRQREYDTAEARLRAIESRLRDRLIAAPFSGIVGLRNISVGALVNPGDKITTVDDDTTMKLDFSVPSIYLGALRPGLGIVARAAAFGDEAFKGEIASIDSQIDPITRSVVVRALIPNPEGRLKPGLLMRVELMKDPRETLVLPEEALIPTGRENYVLLVSGQDGQQTVERRAVVIGSRRPGEVEVREGLAAGDRVVTHGTLIVQPGQAVTIRTIQKPGDKLQDLLRQKAQKPEAGQAQ